MGAKGWNCLHALTVSIEFSILSGVASRAVTKIQLQQKSHNWGQWVELSPCIHITNHALKQKCSGGLKYVPDGSNKSDLFVNIVRNAYATRSHAETKHGDDDALTMTVPMAMAIDDTDDDGD